MTGGGGFQAAGPGFEIGFVTDVTQRRGIYGKECFSNTRMVLYKYCGRIRLLVDAVFRTGGQNNCPATYNRSISQLSTIRAFRVL